MATVVLRGVLFVIFTIYVFGDEIEMEVQSGTILKMLRDMVNQNETSTLTLPANATSIRENITDNFSCENRTYGYYADVENECQLFHVCLLSQTPSGRNVTYKWSFICPKETVFNQEVLVCTRPIDSIPCAESPNFYDLNMEIGKIADPDINKETRYKDVETVTVKNKKQTIRKKQNIIMEALMKDADDQMEAIEELIDGEKVIEVPEETKMAEIPNKSEEPNRSEESNKSVEPNRSKEPNISKEPNQFQELNKFEQLNKYEQPIRNLEIEVKPTSEVNRETLELHGPADEEEANERLGSERSMNRKGRHIWRGSLKFKSNV